MDELRNRALLGSKFRRQYPIESYVVDLYSPDRRSIIEIDGPLQNGRKECDVGRERRLVALGFRVLRFKYEVVLLNVEGVLERIVSDRRDTPHPNPLPFRGEGT